MEDLGLGMVVYHKDIYDGRWPMKVIGLRVDQVELEGDFSGGTHDVCQSDWLPRSGISLERNEKPYSWNFNPLPLTV